MLMMIITWIMLKFKLLICISAGVLHMYSDYYIYTLSNTPLFEIDPDIQYYMDMNYTENIKCNYYFEDVSMRKWRK